MDMKNSNPISSEKAVLYMDRYGELHIPKHVQDLIKKMNSAGYKIEDFKMTGQFSGTLIASDL